MGQEIIRVDPRYFRSAEVETLLGDRSKSKAELGLEPEITVQEVCQEMVEEDYKAARNLLPPKLALERAYLLRVSFSMIWATSC